MTTVSTTHLVTSEERLHALPVNILLDVLDRAEDLVSCEVAHDLVSFEAERFELKCGGEQGLSEGAECMCMCVLLLTAPKHS